MNEQQEEELEIDISFFPANVFYKNIGIEYFLLKRKIIPTPMMLNIFKDMEIKDVTEFPKPNE